MNAQTPMLKQYFALKAEHPDVLLAMRVGDFYEFYGPDADAAAKTAEITLTGREDGSNGRISMAGVPFHAIERYLAKLVAGGHKVAICDQLEDPKQAKGLVKRGITRILTPGTLMEDALLQQNSNNFLVAICVQDGHLGLATLDTSTGEFAVTEVAGAEALEKLVQEIARLRPSELLIPTDTDTGIEDFARDSLGSTITKATPPKAERSYDLLVRQFNVNNLSGFGCEDLKSAQVAAAMILNYANRNSLGLSHVEGIQTYSVDGFMRLDHATRRSLELTASLGEVGKKITLFSALNTTQTAMGARLLKRYIEQPLLDKHALIERQEAVSKFVRLPSARGDLRAALAKLGDLERLASRIAAQVGGPRDLGALCASLLELPNIDPPLRMLGTGKIQQLREQISDHGALAQILVSALAAELPPHARDGGILKPGYDVELDRLRELSAGGKSFIASLESQEKEATGITNLKVGFNSVFGYFLEVPKSQISKVPAHYIRKQTTANAERYITAELKEQESLVLGAEEKAIALEIELFHQLRAKAASEAPKLLATARAIAEIDVLSSFAQTAVNREYVCPEIVDEDVLEIVEGRHPVVETTSKGFVPNDTNLGPTRTIILTGPNMSGKSTYLRQNALIVLLAQIGSFVPAKKCRMGLCDRIFARIGAKDDLAMGQSTFMVEMVESANILNHATERSLVILDEVGRGTSTFDGLAIAWAMSEHLTNIGTKTLFATHYHQMNALSEQIKGVENYRVAVQERDDLVIWTHKVLPGGTDRSYGIQVAKMAGVPNAVLGRATEILADLEGKGVAPTVPVQKSSLQLNLFEAEEPAVVSELKKLDLDHMTPLEALLALNHLKGKV